MDIVQGAKMDSNDAPEILVRLRGVTKEYQFHETPMKRALSMMFPWLNFNHRSHLALDNVSLTVRRGQTIGVIGRNGAGKSTLLGVICGAVAPTSGLAEVRGTVAGILELGAGFNSELTGRENAVLYTRLRNDASKAQANQTREIEDFADLGDYFDRPIKTYSSGMVARLAFACAISLHADILVIDEALAVGDARFQAKCLDYIKGRRSRGVTVIIVTHSPEVIQRNCDWAILIERGKIARADVPREVTDAYEAMLYGTHNSTVRHDIAAGNSEGHGSEALAIFGQSLADGLTLRQKPNYNRHEERATLPDYDVRIDDFVLKVGGERYPTQIQSGSTVDLFVKISSKSGHPRVQTGFGVFTKDGVKLYGANSSSLSKSILNIPACGHAWVHYSLSLPFATGDYFFDVGCGDHSFSPPRILDWRRRFIHLRIVANESWDGLADCRTDFRIIEIARESIIYRIEDSQRSA